ncbi:MAG: NACHT domain-containing protein, partial [Pleurocapsa sp.]
MAKPSLRASVEGLNTAKQKLKIVDITQKKLGEEIGCSRQPLTNFFKGEAISQELFIKICDRLNLDWQIIAGLKTSVTAQKNRIYSSLDRDRIVSELPSDSYDLTQFSFSAVTQPEGNLDDLVAKLRSQVRPSIQEQCGTMRILDMSHPVEINDIYTNVNILEKITGRRHKRLEQLLSKCESEDFERFGLGNVESEKISGLEAVKKYQKLIILGKPGAGKTTFLKHLAVQCVQGNFEVERVPIFVNLKSFAESANKPSLLEYIAAEVASYTPTVNLTETYSQDFAAVLQMGKGLILLDGLDEVRSEDSERLIKEIREFSQQFRHNHFAITCRIAAWEYTFEKFTEVEVADFDRTQVKAFAR